MLSRTRYSGMSDSQLYHERKAQIALALAVDTLRLAITNTNLSSSVVQVDPKAFEDFVHDEIPDTKFWDEKIEQVKS